MWRALFLALGAYSCILGVEALTIDRAVLKEQVRNGQVVQGARVVDPPDWAPWSLLSAGAVVVLYSFTLPKRAQG